MDSGQYSLYEIFLVVLFDFFIHSDDLIKSIFTHVTYTTANSLQTFDTCVQISPLRSTTLPHGTFQLHF